MITIEKIDLKFKEFFAEKTIKKAQFLAHEILNSLDEGKFAVYTYGKNKETPYAKLFEYYFEGFYAERNPNIDSLKIIHNEILKRILSDINQS